MERRKAEKNEQDWTEMRGRSLPLKVSWDVAFPCTHFLKKIIVFFQNLNRYFSYRGAMILSHTVLVAKNPCSKYQILKHRWNSLKLH